MGAGKGAAAAASGVWELNPLGIPEPVMNYSVVFPFERDFDVMPTTRFFQESMWPVSLGICGAYLVAIHLGGRLMKAFGPDVELKPLLFAWNLFLALFSLAGSVRMLPELYHVLSNFGFEYSVCNPSFSTQPVTAFWTECFAWSKVLELGDTALLVLRKRPVIFLHWYHHVTVLVYTWHACKDHTAAGRWFIGMNYTIHAVMYAYYAARAAGIRRLPKIIPLSITTSQLGQMLVGCYVALTVHRAKSTGKLCQQSYENVLLCLSMYATYALLFANYFLHAYCLKPKRPQPEANGKANGKVQVNGLHASNGRTPNGRKAKKVD